MVPRHDLLARRRCNRGHSHNMHLNATLQAGPGIQRPSRNTIEHSRSRLGGGLQQGLISLTEGNNSLLLPALRPEMLLCALSLCFLRVQVGRSAGLKATKHGLLCGHMSGIGSSAAGELLSGSSSIGV